MDLKGMINHFAGIIKKYKFAAILLLIGILLMVLPNLIETETNREEYVQVPQTEDVDICEQIAQILSSVKGVGDVRVMLTIASGEETVYQTDDRTTQGNDSTVTQSDSIIITNAERAQDGLIKQVISAKYQGAIIVCDGADSPSVQLAVIDAVSKVTGLSSDKISVMKMK